MTLLDKAKKVQKQGRKTIDDETIELALAWLKGDISFGQMAKALGITHGSNVYNFAARNVRAAYIQGRVKIVKSHGLSRNKNS